MSYNPQKFLRLTSNDLLKELFLNQNCHWDAQWDKLPPSRMDFIYSEFNKLPSKERCNLELVMQDVYSIADSDDGINQLIKTAKFCEVELSEEFFKYQSRCDKALWFRLRYHELWTHVKRCVYTDALSQKYWVRYIDLPQKSPKTDKESLSRFGKAISLFYIDSEGRGHAFEVEHFKRAEGLDYFFIYLSDHPKTYEIWDMETGFQRRSECRLFELVFALNSNQGTLDIHAHGSGSAKSALKEIFMNEILDDIFIVSHIYKSAYDIDQLKYSSFNFYTDPDDEILNVAIKKMTLSKQEKGETLIALQVAPESEDFYEVLEHDLNIKELNLETLIVEKVTLSIKAIHDGHLCSFAMDISSNSCNLKSKCEWQRALGEKYLKNWRIDNAAKAA